ncbi:MAG TPA: hypothetical protein VGE37_13615 [Archangium sp.]
MSNRLHKDVVLGSRIESGPVKVAIAVVVSTVDLARIEDPVSKAFVGAFDRLNETLGGLLTDRFETMVFACDAEGKVTDFSDLDCARTHDPEAVEAQHAAMVAKWKAVLQ